MEALKSLYGTSRKQDVDMSNKETNAKNKIVLPPFPKITEYVHTEADLCIKDQTKRVTVANHTLPFTVKVYIEVVYD